MKIHLAEELRIKSKQHSKIKKNHFSQVFIWLTIPDIKWHTIWYHLVPITAFNRLLNRVNFVPEKGVRRD